MPSSYLNSLDLSSASTFFVSSCVAPEGRAVKLRILSTAFAIADDQRRVSAAVRAYGKFQGSHLKWEFIYLVLVRCPRLRSEVRSQSQLYCH